MCDSNFAARNLYHFFMGNYDLRKKEILKCGKTRSKMTKLMLRPKDHDSMKGYPI